MLKILLSALNITSSLVFAIVLLGTGSLRVQAVYTSTSQSQGLIGTVLSGLWGLPLVVEYGDPSFVRDTGMVRRFGLLLESISLNNSDAVISSDPVIGRYVHSRYARTSLLLPNGYDSTLFPLVPCRPQRPHAESVVTFVGKIDTSVYRLDILLLASQKVLKAVRNAKFRLIGSGPDVDKLKQMAHDLGVERSIEFVGFIPHENVRTWMCESDVCVDLTNDTCLGMKVMEYMAAGKPIIIAAQWWDKYDAVIESGRNCITVPLDPDALAAAILKLMRNRNYAARLARNAYESSRRYSWNETSEAMLEAIRNLLPQSDGSLSRLQTRLRL